MNLALRIFAVILGICIVLPGVCTVLFGGYFAIGALSSGGQDYGMGAMSIPWLLVGGLVTWIGVLVLIWAFRRRG